MEDVLCPVCRRPLGEDPRRKTCSSRCKWRGYWQRAVASAVHIEELPLATLPPEADEILPVGPERLAMVVQMAVIGRAPAGARGYRVGIKHRLSQIQRWFPAASRAEVPMFGLDPFEWPAAPVSGIYAVVSLDARCLPLGGPRFSVAIDWIDRRLHDSDGDRTYKPPLRA